MIVEMNACPDMLLFQLADGEGMLDPTFRQFLDRQARARSAYATAMKKSLRD